jgi:hypothetical protein
MTAQPDVPAIEPEPRQVVPRKGSRLAQLHADSWIEAEDARLAMPPVVRDVLEVVERQLGGEAS